MRSSMTSQFSCNFFEPIGDLLEIEVVGVSRFGFGVTFGERHFKTAQMRKFKVAIFAAQIDGARGILVARRFQSPRTSLTQRVDFRLCEGISMMMMIE